MYFSTPIPSSQYYLISDTHGSASIELKLMNLRDFESFWY
jgi:hypothetical protein